MTLAERTIQVLSFALVLLLIASPATSQEHIAITPATVVDVTDGSLLADQTVIIEGDRIATVGPADDVAVPEGFTVVDGTGGYVIPGLWDMHSHIAREENIEPFSKLLIAHGITGARDMWGSLEVGEQARAAIASGALVGPPRLVVAGNIVDGFPPSRPGFLVADTPEAGRRIVDSLHVAGAPFVKVYFTLSPETYRAIAERARAVGIYIAGHVPVQVPAADASDAGQRSFEHMTGIFEGCSRDEEEVLNRARTLITHFAEGNFRALVAEYAEPIRYALETQDDDHCRRLLERLVENETWQVPTLASLRGKAYLREFAAEGDPRERYFAPPDRWTGGQPFGFPLSEDQWEIFQGRYEREKEIVGMMADAGVPLLAGSDMLTPWVFPGFGLHDELEVLVEAGLTPLQALQTSTLNPARYFDRTDELGTVEAGKLADLVLLDANPLEDIANTTRIRAVVANGRLYRRADLDEALADVEASVTKADVDE